MAADLDEDVDEDVDDRDHGRSNRGWMVRLSIVLLGCGGGLPEVPPSVEREDAAGVLAQETCRSLFDCDCPVNPYRSREHCGDVLEQRGHDADMVAAAAGLQYDGVCASQIVTTRRELDCGVVDEAPCVPCRPFHGGGALGEPCEKLGVTVDVDTCERGLRCVDRVCVPLCPAGPVLTLGERCSAGLEVLGECERGLHCDSETQTCTVSPVLGEPCPDGTCTEGTWCDRAASDDPTCARPLEAGAGCLVDESCTSGRCEDGRCAATTASVCTLPAP